MEWCGQKYTYEMWPDERIIYKHKVHTPPKIAKKKVLNYGIVPQNQKFPYPDKKMVESVNAKFKNIGPNGEFLTALTPREEEWLNQQYDYYENGMWFFNNGYLEYVTGLHWFYLSYWKIPRKIKIKEKTSGRTRLKKTSDLPDFKDSDRDRFLLWEEIMWSKTVSGMLEITNRRDGKSHRGTCTAFYLISAAYDANAAFQSKTETDAKKLFKKMITSWKLLPEFWKPVDTGDSNPQSVLIFDEPGRRSSKNTSKTYAKVLRSSIYHANAKEEALDGEDLYFTVQDEVGKTKPKEADVSVRWDIVKECMVDGSDVIGRALLTTTVEEMDKKGGAQCFKIWQDSDLKTVRKNGFTKSTLWQYFKPAYYGYTGGEEGAKDEFISFTDEYGYSNVEAAKKHLMGKREGLHGEDLWSEARKWPMNETEAFRSASKESVFMLERIFDQQDYNITLPKGYVRSGTFIGNIHDGFKFVDKDKGPFNVSMIPPPKEQNARMDFGIHHEPMYKTTRSMGCDPYDHSDTSGRFSQAGLHAYESPQPDNPSSTGGVFLEYIYRQPSVGLFCQDVIAACVFYGSQVLIENQKQVLINTMQANGLNRYIVHTNDAEFTKTQTNRLKPGISTSGQMVRETMMSDLAEFIAMYVGKIDIETQIKKFGFPEDKIVDNLYGRLPFNRTLEQIKDFEPAKWTEYDGVVSLMLTILEHNRKNKKFRKAAEQSMAKKTNPLEGMFATFNNSGKVSRVM